MCVNVAWTAGCTFASVEEAQNAANAKLASTKQASNCVSVLWTAGCSFGDVNSAVAAANSQFDKTVASKDGCGSVLFTAVCSV